mgnify:FL=1
MDNEKFRRKMTYIIMAVAIGYILYTTVDIFTQLTNWDREAARVRQINAMYIEQVDSCRPNSFFNFK